MKLYLRSEYTSIVWNREIMQIRKAILVILLAILSIHNIIQNVSTYLSTFIQPLKGKSLENQY